MQRPPSGFSSLDSLYSSTFCFYCFQSQTAQRDFTFRWRRRGRQWEITCKNKRTENQYFILTDTLWFGRGTLASGQEVWNDLVSLAMLLIIKTFVSLFSEHIYLNLLFLFLCGCFAGEKVRYKLTLMSWPSLWTGSQLHVGCDGTCRRYRGNGSPDLANTADDSRIWHG